MSGERTPKRKPMIGKLINIDLWLARELDGELWIFTREPTWNEKRQEWVGERLFCIDRPYRAFSGLIPGQCCRVRMQRME